DDTALNWPGSWGSPSDPSADGFSEEDGVFSVVSMATVDEEEFPAPADACEAAELETARMRRLADAKARQLQEFQAREAARVRAYRRLARLQAAANAGSAAAASARRAASASGSSAASPRSQQPPPVDWETLRQCCHRETLAARRALVGRRQPEPSLRRPLAGPLNSFVDVNHCFSSPQQQQLGQDHLAVSAASSTFDGRGGSGGGRRGSATLATSAVVAAAKFDAANAAAAAESARRQRAAQRSLSALSERESARRWRRRREASARARRVKAEGEAMAAARLAADCAVPANATASDPECDGDGGRVNGDEGGDETIASVTELTHTVLTLATTGRDCPNGIAADQPEEEPTNGDADRPKNQLLFLQSLQKSSNGASARRHRKPSPAAQASNASSTSSGSSLDDITTAADKTNSRDCTSVRDSQKWQWLLSRCQHLGLTVPPLCPCNPSAVDAFTGCDPSGCALNCMFYRRPRALLAAVADFVRAADPTFPPPGTDWWLREAAPAAKAADVGKI
ncbi:hypothetical protein BOX15_Mlig019405g2, partial [Macrostomum lignano]